MAGDLRIGIVGAGGRGGNFARLIELCGGSVQAVCDNDPARLDQAATALGVPEKYDDFERMLEKSDLQAVIVGTPMPLHVPQSIQALDHGLHVMCEVPAAVSIEEARQLVLATRRSHSVYMMAENYCYTRPNMVIRQLVRQGAFGETYYAEGEYLHELKELNEITRWRRQWQTGIEGVTYPTHSLGPILQWMNDRVVRLSCEGTGHHYKDPRGEHYHSESPVMLCKTSRGGLIKIRLDMVSDRPHALYNYQLQGTDGAYESGREHGGNRIWLRQLSRELRWHDLEGLLNLDQFRREFIPADWQDLPAEARQSGHRGGDYFVIRDFLRAARGEMPPPVGIHEAMDMTLPGLVSQQSILQEGKWLAVSDSRTWDEKPPYRQLMMVWPQDRLDSPPDIRVAEGYRLRMLAEGEEAAWMDLMHQAKLGQWDQKAFDKLRNTILPDGLFVIEHAASGTLVGTAMAQHRPNPQNPYGAELGWVAADPAHAGKGLGQAVSAAAVGRMIQAGYRRIYLTTDDSRLPALKTYLRMGFRPLPYTPDMEQRWADVKAKLDWKEP